MRDQREKPKGVRCMVKVHVVIDNRTKVYFWCFHNEYSELKSTQPGSKFIVIE